MKKYRTFYIREFTCPVCTHVIYASKKSSKMTNKGHEKKLWCPFCKMKINMMQTGETFVK